MGKLSPDLRRYSLYYIIGAVLWILFSDRFIALIFNDLATLARFQLIKGLLFVLVTALWFNWLMERETQQRDKLEAARAETEKLYRALIVGGADGMIVCDQQAVVVLMNPRMCEMLGYTEPEAIGMHLGQFVSPEAIAQRPLELHRVVNASGQIIVSERELIRKDGTRFLGEIHTCTLPNGMIQGLVRDISERKRLEEEQRHQTELLQLIFDHIPVMISVSGFDGKLDLVNREYERLMGYSLQEIREHPDIFRAFYPDPKDYDRVVATIGTNLQWFDFTPRTRSGALLHTTWTNVNLSNGRSIGIGQNIEQRVQTEKALKDLNEKLEERVKTRTVELTRANERLKELDQLRMKFVAHVSHELRNPVTSLSVKLGMLKRNPGIEMRNHLDELIEQVDHLKTLIERVLDMSRIDLGKEKPSFVPVDLHALIDREVYGLRPLADEKGLDIRVRLVSGAHTVTGDPNQIALLVSNLITNALRYTERGYVQVVTEQDMREPGIFLRIADSGIGIDAEDIPHLFERFYRGQTATSANISGSGLGLSIVKEVVDLHQGKIEVQSVPGEGTTFTVWLPVLGKRPDVQVMQ